MPLYKTDGSWCFSVSFWKYLYLTHFVGYFEISFDEESKKQMDLELIQIFLFSIKSVRCENLYSLFFYELKLYLSVSDQCTSAWGSVLTSRHALLLPAIWGILYPRQCHWWWPGKHKTNSTLVLSYPLLYIRDYSSKESSCLGIIGPVHPL